MKKLLTVVIVMLFVFTLSGCDKIVSEELELLQTIEPSEYIIEQEYTQFTGACLISTKVGDVTICTLYQKFWNLDYKYIYEDIRIMEIRKDSGMSASPIMWFSSSNGDELEGSLPICKYQNTITRESGEVKIKIEYDFCE